MSGKLAVVESDGLRSDVTERLGRPFPRTAIKQRRVGGGQSLAYVEGHTVIHRLIEATDNRFDVAIRDIRWSEGLVTATVALTIPGLGTREHIGVQAIHERGGEDLVKGAVTDALKKAATLFGVGLELYGPDYEAGEFDARPPQNAPQAPRSAERRESSQPPPEAANARPGLPRQSSGASDRDGPLTGGVTDKQRGMILKLCQNLGMGDGERHQMQQEVTGHASLTTMGRADASRVIDYLKGMEADPPEPGSPEDLAEIERIAASSHDAATGAHLDWTETQLRWKEAIDQATTARQFDAIGASIPKDRHGNPDAMLTDYLAGKREQQGK